MKTQFFVLLLIFYLEMSICSVKEASALSLIQKSTVRLHELKVDIDNFSSSKSSKPSATATAGPVTVKADSNSVSLSLPKSSTLSSTSKTASASSSSVDVPSITSVAKTSSASSSSVKIPSVTTTSSVISSAKTAPLATSSATTASSATSSATNVSSSTSSSSSVKTTPLKLETTKVVVKAMGDVDPDPSGGVSNQDICAEAKILDSLLLDIDGVVAELTDALNDHMNTLLQAKKDSVEAVDRNKWAAWAERVLEFFISKVNELRTILDGISAANLTAKNNHCIIKVESTAQKQITIFIQNIEAAAKKLGFGASYVQNKLKEMNLGKKNFLRNNKLKH